MGHLPSSADSDDEKDGMVEDLHDGHGRKPKTESKKAPGCPKETASRHFPVPEHLLVVRVLQENLGHKRMIKHLKICSPSRQADCPLHIWQLPFQASLQLLLQLHLRWGLDCRDSFDQVAGDNGAPH